MGTSINTNVAAYFAQANIQAASNAAQSSVARLSSGNAIVNASDNVAALAIGTALASQVSALKTAGTNAAQGGSLLQVADGALAQIQSILQQQQSIALQAKSGSLTNTNRGFLNQQFQALAAEINILATGTTFNGVNLIDGSIAAAGTVGSTNPLLSQSADVTSPATLAGTVGATTTAAAYGPSSGNGDLTYTGFASNGHISANTVVIPPASGGNDAALYGALSGGSFTVTTNGTIGASTTSYHISYAINGVTYTGDLATSANDGAVSANTTVTLTASSNPSDHASIIIAVDATGYAAADNHAAIQTSLGTAFASATGYAGAFLGAADVGHTAVTNPSANATTYDAALYGDLSKGSFNVYASSAAGVAGTVGAGGTALGYTVEYSINGVTYRGQIANDTTAGHGAVAAAATLTLTATVDPTLHSTIALKVGTKAFGADQTINQSANLKAALETNFKNATLLSTTTASSITGTTSTSGITAVSHTNNIGQNDTALVGDLSLGTFQVTGSNGAGFNVSYTTAEGSTYQGSLSSTQTANGHSLILSNGKGSIAFTIAASAAATATTADALKTALQTFFTSTTSNVTTGATAYAKHTVATALDLDANGAAIPGSGITLASNVGTYLEGIDGSKVTLQSSSFTGGASNLPPIATFTSTGTGTSTQLSVIINGVTYKTGLTAESGINPSLNSGGGAVYTSKWDAGSATLGAAGIVTFFKNGDDTNSDKLTLDLSNLTHATLFNTEGDLANFTDALNAAFGSGGSTGGLNFQLGSTVASNVTVNIGSAKTVDLFSGASLDISTQTGADLAATTVGTAIDTLTALRAGVGALESQFNFAAAAIQSSVQNQDAARGQLLDTDISTESTSFATQQVKLQAGISVLAQANQQLQALLKLIG